MIYLDHAATSWPKPAQVAEAMGDYLEGAGGNPGRSGHSLSIEAARIVYDVRESLAGFFNSSDPMRVVFTANATHSINAVLRGFVSPGDRVVTTASEHNAVMRPLRAMESEGVVVHVVRCESDGQVDIEAFAEAVFGGARLAVFHHASNVTGAIQPLGVLARISRDQGVPVLVDAAQTAGARPIDIQAMHIDFLAFTGHKALLGPPGTGGLVLGPDVDPAQLRPLICGGTGSVSDSEEQPQYLPDRYESGTPNGVGIAGLGAGLRCILEYGLESVETHDRKLAQRLISGLVEIPGVRAYGPAPGADRAPLVCFNVSGMSASEVARRLDHEHHVLCRSGLQCAPAAHRVTGTYPTGAVRFSAGYGTTEEEVDIAVAAVREMSRKGVA